MVMVWADVRPRQIDVSIRRVMLMLDSTLEVVRELDGLISRSFGELLDVSWRLVVVAI
jgi:hypothetical protein